MTDDNDDDVPLLNGDDDNDEQLITSEDSQPNVEAIFVVTFDVKYGKTLIQVFFLSTILYNYSR